MTAIIIRTFIGEWALKTPHGTMTNRTTRSFAVTPAGERLEKGSVRLYKFFAFFLPQKFLFEFIASFYKSGVFLLKIYDVLLEQAKLSRGIGMIHPFCGHENVSMDENKILQEKRDCLIARAKAERDFLIAQAKKEKSPFRRELFLRKAEIIKIKLIIYNNSDC